MKNLIYKYFIFQIHWAIRVIVMSFEELYEITSLDGYFSIF